MATAARHLGGIAVVAVVAAAALGSPVSAQLPELAPLTLFPTDPATTTTTLLPPNLLPADLLPAPTSPAPGSPPSSLVLLPTAPPPRRTTAYRPPPVPPSTPARVAAKPKTATAKGTPASTDVPEEATDEGGFEADLPFATQEAEFPAGNDTMELGVEASARSDVGSLASIAAGLILSVLLGVALWLRSEIRRPAPLPPW